MNDRWPRCQRGGGTESLKAPKNPGAGNRRTWMAGVITGEPQSAGNPVLGNGVRAGQD